MKGGNQGDTTGMLSTQQKIFVQDKIKLPLEVGQTWYLLDSKWFTKWKEYVNYADSDNPNHTADYPGAIDNSGILTSDGELRDKLMENVDFDVVPTDVWNMLVKTYGIEEGQSAIDRSVVESGSFRKITRVEYYPLELLLSHYKDPTNGKIEKCTQSMTLGELEEKMRELYEISEAAEVKLLGSYMSATYDALDDLEQTISTADLQPRQFVVIVEKEGAVWPNPSLYKKSTPSFQPPKPKQAANNSTVAILPSSSASNRNTYSSSISQAADNSMSNGYGSSSYSNSNGSVYNNKSSFGRSETPGLCGLSNIGNTCFMNSALQCLSNVPMLTAYFRENKWKEDLNEDNPLGMGGQIAESYAALMEQMWNGKNSSVVPKRFKGAVGRFAPRFSGYQQQDSHELMAFLLDGLHEDLNRIKKKPYVETKPADGRPDQVVADEAWANYRKRNDSIIVDLFHGQLKSTLRCPDCEDESVIFDPFCYLSVPIPGKAEKKLNICYVTPDLTKLPIKCRVKVPVEGTFEDIFEALSKLFGAPKEKMKGAEIYNNRFHRLYEKDHLLRSFRENDQLFVYELNHADDAQIVSVYFRESTTSKLGKQTNISWPMLISLPKEIAYDELYDALRTYCQIFIDEKEESIYLSGNHNADIVESDEAEKLDVSKDEMIGQAQDDEPMDVCGSPKALNPRSLFQIHFVSQYGSPELCNPVSADKVVTIKDNATLSVEFDKQLFGTVVKTTKTLEVENHNSLYESDRDKNDISLEDCLQLFASEEQLGKEDTWYCPRCKSHVQAFKKFALWKLPKYLVIQLKRYKSSLSSYSYYNRDKIDKLVNYPTDDLDLSRWVIGDRNKCHYELTGVSNHFGGLGGGHYTAFAKNHKLGKWYNFDDSCVSAASKDSLVSRSGYLLVYERKE